MLHQVKKTDRRTTTSNRPLRRLAATFVIGYLVFVVLFYFLAGEQLHLRDSRGNIALPIADSGTVELAAGILVEQTFTVEIQRLETIGVQWGTYYRPNAGTVVMELYDTRTSTLLMSQQFDASAIIEGGLTEMTAEEPIEGLYGVPLLLRVYSLDSQCGFPTYECSDPRSGFFSLTERGSHCWYSVLHCHWDGLYLDRPTLLGVCRRRFGLNFILPGCGLASVSQGKAQLCG